MDTEKLKELRKKLTELPPWPWHFVIGKDANAVDRDIRIDVYSGEEVKSIRALNPKASYKQIFHYHGQNNTMAAVGLEWMKKNEKVMETIKFVTRFPEILDALLNELGH